VSDCVPLLLCRSSLLPGESLPSLLLRLAMRNHYEPPTVLNGLCLVGLEKDRLDRPVRAATYERITALTGIDSFELYKATVHCFAEILTPPGIPIDFFDLPDGQTVPLLAKGIGSKQLRPVSAAQFCPACLEESAHHRLAWMPMAAAICLKHKCLLVHRCPNCQESVTVCDVVKTRCRNCGFDLARGEIVSVEDDVLGYLSQQVIQAWMGIAPVPGINELHIPEQSHRVLYRVLDGLRHVAMNAGIGWHYLHRFSGDTVDLVSGRTKLSPAESYCLYTTAFKGIVNWPESFFDYLQACTVRSGRKPKRGLYADLGSLYAVWLQYRWRHPEFEFLQDTFDRYIVENYAGSYSVVQSRRYQDNPTLAAKFPCMTIAEAARLLGVSAGTVNRLVESGLLTRYEVSERDTHCDFVQRSGVMEMCSRWSDAISLQETAARLGLSEDVTLDLVDVDLLQAERGPSVDGSNRWMFSIEAVDQVLEDVATQLDSSRVRNMVDLTTAAKMLSIVGLNAARVIKCVADGEIRAYGEPPLRLGALCFRRFDIRKHVEVVKAANGWLTRNDIARQMGVKVTVASKWISAGLLRPSVVCGSAFYFDSDDVEQFVADHVFSEKAAKILGVDRVVVQKWARNGRLKPVSGPGVDACHRYLFRREDVERLCPERRLTAPQMAARLGISRSQMWHWIRQGKVVPVSGPGIDGCGHYLFTVSGMRT
jgi:predicted site-specific integrase-resolvase